MRGALAIGFLKRLETVLRERHQDPQLTLSDYFDVIGGTSVGAILAAGLALGRSMDEIETRFRAMAPRIFAAGGFRLPGVQARFNPALLAKLLQEEFGDHTLGTAPWKTGFASISKRVDTASTWVLTNCPRAKYWGRDEDGRRTSQEFTPNADYLLAKVVQASAAAPFFFDMVDIEISHGERGLFFDGAMTPHNNPALQLAMTVLIPNFGFAWNAGEDELMVVSVGAGGPRPRRPEWVGRRVAAILKALHALIAVSYDTGELSTSVLQWLGASPQRWWINSEVEDLRDALPKGFKPLWTVVRYDAPLERAWLSRELGLERTRGEMARLIRMDDARLVDALYDIGCKAADKQISVDHFPSVLGDPDRRRALSTSTDT